MRPLFSPPCPKSRARSFVPADLLAFAYDDRPLPIGEGQTISQPYIVAVMIEALKLEGGDKVLEIGTGSGYVAALLSKIAAEVFTVERIEPLATRPQETEGSRLRKCACSPRRRHSGLERARAL